MIPPYSFYLRFSQLVPLNPPFSHMADLQDSPVPEGQQPPATGQVLYLNSAASPDMPFDRNNISSQKASYSAFEIRVDKLNPNRAELVPVASANEALMTNYSTMLNPAFAAPVPKAGDKYIHVEQPAQLEKVGDTWRITERGSLAYGPTPKVEQAPQVEQPAQVRQPVAPTVAPAAVATEPPASPTLNFTQYLPSTESGVVEGRKAVGQALPQLNLGMTEQGQFGLNPQVNQERLIGDGLSKLEKYFDFALPNQHKIARVAVDQPGQMEQTAEGWRVVTKGSLAVTDTEGNVFRPVVKEAPAQQVSQAQQTTQEPATAATQAKETTPAAEVQRPAEVTPAAPAAKSAASLGLDANPEPAPVVSPVQEKAAPAAEQAQPGVGELKVTWTQKGSEIAPMAEMRAYFDSLKEQGVAVGAMKFGPGKDGKLTGSFDVSYDPNTPDLTKLEGTIQGLKKVGGGLDVVEKPEQAAARRQALGNDGQDKALYLAYPIKEAFGVRQWDSLSAQLSSAPKQALTVPEQAQQAAGIERVGQIAKLQGKTTDTIIQDGKNLLEIDTSGNPVSAFLKNFYEHLNGAAKTRQNLEVDYEKTRQELQARLTAKAGHALPDGGPAEAVAKIPAVAPVTEASAPRPEGQAPVSPAAAKADTPAQAQAAPVVPKPEPLFKESELPKDKLALFGLNIAALKASGQFDKLVNGEKTDLLAMQGGAQRDKPLVPFEGKLQLHREPNGSVTLNVELPRQRLVIPNEIGGQPFTPEQKHQLETTGTAGLIRGLRDAAGNPYNGYVGVDPKMNTIVILPENKVTIKDEIAGVKLSPEQSKDLREGHLVHLPNMRQPNGGKPFDGTVQIHAAHAGVEVRPESYERQQPKLAQPQPVATERAEKPGEKQTVHTKEVQRHEVTTKPVEKVEEPVQQRRSGPRR